MKLISDKMATELENLMGMCFAGNRIADRIQAQLKVKFVMPILGNIVHEDFAHKMPLVADTISDYCDSRNYAVNYPITPRDDTDYDNIKQMFDKLLEYMLDLEKQTSKVIDLSLNENDKVTKVFLEDFLEDIVPYTSMILGIVDYIETNGYTPKDNRSMDGRIQNFLKAK